MRTAERSRIGPLLATALLAAVSSGFATGCVSRRPPVAVEISALRSEHLGHAVEVSGVPVALEYALDRYGWVVFALEAGGATVECAEEGTNVLVLSDLASRLEGAKANGAPVTVTGVYTRRPDPDGVVRNFVDIDTARFGEIWIDTGYGDATRRSAGGWVY